MYEEILNDRRLQKHHLSALSGHPTGTWVDKTIRAMSAGYSPEDIVRATVGHDSSWTGEVSNMGQSWINDFEPLTAHEDPRIRSVADIAITKIREYQATARKRERQEAVYGR